METEDRREAFYDLANLAQRAVEVANRGGYKKYSGVYFTWRPSSWTADLLEDRGYNSPKDDGPKSKKMPDELAAELILDALRKARDYVEETKERLVKAEELERALSLIAAGGRNVA